MAIAPWGQSCACGCGLSVCRGAAAGGRLLSGELHGLDIRRVSTVGELLYSVCHSAAVESDQPRVLVCAVEIDG